MWWGVLCFQPAIIDVTFANRFISTILQPPVPKYYKVEGRKDVKNDATHVIDLTINMNDSYYSYWWLHNCQFQHLNIKSFEPQFNVFL